MKTVVCILHPGTRVPGFNKDIKSLIAHLVLDSGYARARRLASLGATSKFDEETILHRACREGNVDFVKYLLKQGADINALAADGKTPLSIASVAVNKENVELVILLLKCGARIDEKSKDAAIFNPEIAELFEQTEIARAQKAKQTATTFMGIGVGKYKRGRFFTDEKMRQFPPNTIRLISRMVIAASTENALRKNGVR